MTDSLHDPAGALERLFHEPKRLAILSALCTARNGLAFTELRDTCRLTDGNLNRHLKTLEEAGIVRVQKAFVNDKPRTTIVLTRGGLTRFHQYLETLESVLQEARRAARRANAPARTTLAAPVRA
ncbi:MAG: helix-turn-helix domain-containing protein [Lentisphaerae bacterium]|nr:helix-turn-helix domain-containing protein [Lentisphaerota bacterium]